ncbi:MAG: SDR family oxidoreductase [Desulfatirhabdiaceae bacterium]
MRLLDGKLAVIAGVANKMSIAWGIANAYHEQGATIALFCLESNLRRVTKMAKELNIAHVFPFDARNDQSIVEAFESLNTTFNGKLHILVHSIAYAQVEDIGNEFINVSKSGWNLALEVSAFSLVTFCKCARPMMNAAGEGSIIAMTFGGGEKVVPGYNIMGVAKAALNMSIQYLAYDLGPENIRVNGIASGPIKTMSSLMVKDFSNSLGLMEDQSPLLRNVTLEDVSGTALYLASNLSSGISGSIIKVECGMNSVLSPSVSHQRYK